MRKNARKRFGDLIAQGRRPSPVRSLEGADRSQSKIMKIIQILAAIAISLVASTALGQSSDVSALLRKADELDAQEQDGRGGPRAESGLERFA
jgi:hypothetical protein